MKIKLKYIEQWTDTRRGGATAQLRADMARFDLRLTDMIAEIRRLTDSVSALRGKTDATRASARYHLRPAPTRRSDQSRRCFA